MIDEEATFEKYGYYSTDWAQKSNKKIVAVCDVCGAVRYLKKCDYRDLCKKCANHAKIGKYVGENNGRWEDKVVKVCEMCGKEYKVKKHLAANRKYCSYECANKHKSLCNNVVNVCKQCGKEYHIVKARQEISSFCSTVCKAEWQSENWTGENSHTWRGGKVLNVCEWCKSEYRIDVSRSETSRFCSRKCRDEWRAIAFSGENNSSWEGGISFLPYCEKFNNIFKEGIREKYGRRCFVCGKLEEECSCRLDVHHTSYLKDCLCDDIDCYFVPLCKRCHSRTNFNRDFWERTFVYAIQYYEEYYSIDIPKHLLQMLYINK